MKPPTEAEQLYFLWDGLPEAAVFVKDRCSRFVRANRAFLAMHGCERVNEIVGRSDHDFHPHALATHYVAEDEAVMSTARPLVDQAWLVTDRAGMPRWYLCTKAPLFSAEGTVIGLAGLLRPFAGGGRAPDAYERLAPVMDHVLRNCHRKVSVADLARRAGLSASHLQREFRRLFGITVGDYILRLRLMLARTRLEQTSDSLGRIASDCGFYDQSHFTRAFKRFTGLPPRTYRSRRGLPGIGPVDSRRPATVRTGGRGRRS